MISQKYIDLMNQEIDGANSPEQSRKLEDYLSGHAEARTYYRELAMALNVFDKVAMLPPPPGLSDDLLARLDNRAGNGRTEPAATGDKGLLAACRDLFRIRLKPAYAFTFIAGLVFGLVLYAGSTRFVSDHAPELYRNVSGTANHRAWDLESSSEVALDLPGLDGRYHVLLDGPDLMLCLELDAAKPTVIQFSHGPGTVLKHYSSDNPAPSNLTVSSSQVELNHQGRGSYYLVFHQDIENQSPIKMLVYSEGRLIRTESLGE